MFVFKLKNNRLNNRDFNIDQNNCDNEFSIIEKPENQHNIRFYGFETLDLVCLINVQQSGG